MPTKYSWIIYPYMIVAHHVSRQKIVVELLWIAADCAAAVPNALGVILLVAAFFLLFSLLLLVLLQRKLTINHTEATWLVDHSLGLVVHVPRRVLPCHEPCPVFTHFNIQHSINGLIQATIGHWQTMPVSIHRESGVSLFQGP